MAGLFSLDDVKNRPHHSSFDLQAKRAFTAKAGELLPVYWTMTMPGDKFKLKNTWFTRTQPVQTSAYTRMREYYDYFFVPLRQLWKQGAQAVMQLKDNATAASSPTAAAAVGTYFPRCTLGELYSAMTANVTGLSQTFADSSNALGFRRGDLATKLLRYLGYGNFYSPGYEKNYGTTAEKDTYNQAYKSNVYVNIAPILAYQKIYNDFYRDTQWENAAPYTFNVDYWTGEGSFGSFLSQQIQNTNTLGRTMLDLGYCNWNKDLFMGVRPTSQYGDVAIVDVAPSGGVAPGQQVNITGGSLSLQGLAQYVGMDSHEDAGSFFDVVGMTKTSNLAQVYPHETADPSSSPTYDGISTKDPESPTFNNAESLRIGQGSGKSRIGLTASGDVNVWQNATLSSAAAAQSYEFSILALRQAEALQKWKEITLSGDMTYRDQLEKHFGVSISADLSDMVRYLGGSAGNLDISEVVSTFLPNDPSTSGAEANIRGKGTGAGQSQEINFEAKEHGILMCVYHCTPILDYDISGQDPLLLTTAVEDLPIPEFDNLGMQELPLVSMLNVDSDGYSPAEGYLGFVPRYAQWKTAIDRVSGAFSTTLRDWVAPVDDNFLLPFVSNKPGTFPLNFNFFKVNSRILDNIFALQSDATWDTDQFLVNSNFDVRVVRALSVDGMPY